MSKPSSEHRLWKHRKGDEYAVLIQRIVGGPSSFETESTFVPKRQPSLGYAISAGFDEIECDDFNIAVFRGGKFVAVLWMNEIVDDEIPVLRDIARRGFLDDTVVLSDPHEGDK